MNKLISIQQDTHSGVTLLKNKFCNRKVNGNEISVSEIMSKDLLSKRPAKKLKVHMGHLAELILNEKTLSYAFNLKICTL